MTCYCTKTEYRLLIDVMIYCEQRALSYVLLNKDVAKPKL